MQNDNQEKREENEVVDESELEGGTPSSVQRGSRFVLGIVCVIAIGISGIVFYYKANQAHLFSASVTQPTDSVSAPDYYAAYTAPPGSAADSASRTTNTAVNGNPPAMPEDTTNQSTNFSSDSGDVLDQLVGTTWNYSLSGQGFTVAFRPNNEVRFIDNSGYSSPNPSESLDKICQTYTSGDKILFYIGPQSPGVKLYGFCKYSDGILTMQILRNLNGDLSQRVKDLDSQPPNGELFTFHKM